jgi:uncharacterized OB-fold protein
MGTDPGAAPLTAPFVLEYTYKRSLGPVLGRFFGALREGRIEGVRTRAGRVLVPPSEYDPDTGDPVEDFVAVADTGVVTTWSYVPPVAWALIRLDGADTAIFHRIDAAPEVLHTGLRVRARWRSERVGAITDIACFEVLP